MEEIKDLLTKCALLEERHKNLKEEILERTLLNEKAILELNDIEEKYKNILDKLKTLKENMQ